ncbi:hypothetical protein DPMN_146481 [Dreissena polymorpha]|uniref:Uncharacterized protein n=1 Tax=Dreissena polymorpha TaxID=45954 RepID=A0A9D4J211_DREPO|nr:hypothetical protein DPMN_146481 [Dreissena polymorpha]
MPSTNTDNLKGQRLGFQKVIEQLIERLEENDELQFEQTIVAIENQLEIIRSLNEKIIALSDAESTPDELLDSQMYVCYMERDFGDIVKICVITHLQEVQPSMIVVCRCPLCSHPRYPIHVIEAYRKNHTRLCS